MRQTSLTRRGLLGGALAVGALAACEPDRDPDPAPPPRPFDSKDWASVREQFTLDPAVAHFAAFVFASSPLSVRQAIARHRDGFDRNPIEYLHSNEFQHSLDARRAAAGYLGVGSEQVCLTDSTTMGLGLVYNGLRLAPSEEILTTEHDFYSTHESLRMRAARDGVRVRRVQLYADPAKASVDEIVGNLTKALTPATKVVAMTWVHSGTGVKLPVRQIADAIGGRALLCLDAVHGFGAEDAGPAQLGCDFFISGCHKWLFGPRGTGLVWGSKTAWERFNPAIPTFEVRETAPVNAASPGGFKAFEHLWALKEAFTFHREIGRERVAARIRELNGQLKEGLAAVAGVRLVTPRSPELSAGIVCCDFGKSPNEVESALRTDGVHASVTPYNPPYVRFGASMVTSEADVERALAAVRRLA